MYKIFADDTLIYDSTIEDYKIAKGSVSLETNKSGSFTFSIYPDHFFYDRFVRLKTVITVYKSGKIVFRGRILNDVTDYWNNKVLTCEGELGFLQDSIIRPFSFSGTPESLFKKFVEEHNAQVDEFKRFKIGKITVVDSNNYIARSNSAYESALSNLNSRLLEDSLGGYFYITHGDDGSDPIPTINYLADFTKVSSQRVEFGSNLKNYTKTVKGEEIATAIIPLGHEVDDGDDTTENQKLTIASVNDGLDYVYNEEAVALYGWIFKVVTWDDVTIAANLKTKAEEYLEGVVKQSITIELNAIDLHLLDHSIESFSVGDYIRVTSEPHNFDSTLLCNKQTLDLLKPENDTLVLGYTYASFTDTSSKIVSSVSNIVNIQKTVNSITNRFTSLSGTVADTKLNADQALENYKTVNSELSTISGDIEAVAGVAADNARTIAFNAGLIDGLNKNKVNVSDIADDLVTNDPTKVLSAAQGVALKRLIGSGSGGGTTIVPEIADDLVTDDPSIALSAAQGVALKELIDDLDETKLDADDIINDFESVDTSKALSAAQGRTLKLLIDFLDENKLDVDAVIDIAHGGTGATTAAAALKALGLTATATELNHCDGVTANIQTQLDDRYSSAQSRTKNTVLAAPNGAAGAATFRALVAADIPSLSTDKLGSGTLPIARGGTGGGTVATARENLSITGNPNLLDNWYFADPINQRGATSYSAEDYCIDRWYFEQWSNTNPLVELKDGCISISCTDANGDTNTNCIKQTLDNPGRYSGKTVTFSVKFKSVAVDGDPRIIIYSEGASGTKAANKNITASAANSILSVTTTLQSGLTRLMVIIGNYANNGGDGNFTLEIESAKLELGSISTLANDVPPKKSEQLLECQRYYIRFASDGGQWLMGASNGSTLYAPLHLPIPLRVFPDTENGGFNYANVNIYPYVSGGKVEVTNLSLVGASGTQDFMLYANHASNALVAKQPGAIRFTAGGYIELSCEI